MSNHHATLAAVDRVGAGLRELGNACRRFGVVATDAAEAGYRFRVAFESVPVVEVTEPDRHEHERGPA